MLINDDTLERLADFFVELKIHERTGNTFYQYLYSVLNEDGLKVAETSETEFSDFL